jgi:two-component system, OmpR family, response regulator RegX3
VEKLSVGEFPARKTFRKTDGTCSSSFAARSLPASTVRVGGAEVIPVSWTEVRILELCDDSRCALAEGLDAEGWVVERARSADGFDPIERFAPALVVFHAPDPLGIVSRCVGLRGRSGVPIVVLSVSTSETDAIACLRSGADAFLMEPIGARELVARMRALMRRTAHQQAPIDVVVVGPVTLDRAGRHVWVRDRRVTMPRREFDILEVLMREAGRIVTRDALVRELWGAPRDTATLDVQVRRLRARLLAEEGRSRIVTVRGVGYRFATEAEVPAVADVAAISGASDLADFEIDLRDGAVEIDLRSAAGAAMSLRPAAGAHT